MSFPEIVTNVLMNIIIWLLLIYTVIVITWEVMKRLIKKFEGEKKNDSSSSNSNKRKR